jgi:3-hydroxyisobutyrate dehydrogenase-like beta-hydroxyacid dehydrogenase
VTAEPEISEKLAYRCEAAQVGFVEMPLSGSSRAIAAGEALALVGASDDAWALAQPLVELLSPEHVHVGGPGAGARAKLATNLVLGLNRVALAEGLLFAETLGIEGTRFLDMLRRSPAYSRAVDTAGPRMVAGDFTVASRLSQHHKDLRLMIEAAARAGLDLPLARAHAAVLADGEAQGKGDLDNAAVIAVLRDRGKSG